MYNLNGHNSYIETEATNNFDFKIKFLIKKKYD